MPPLAPQNTVITEFISFEKKSCFSPRKLAFSFHTENSFKYAKMKEIWNKRCFNIKVANLWSSNSWLVGGRAPDRVGTIQQSSDPDKSLKLLTFEGFTFSSTRYTYDIYLQPIWRQFFMIFRKCKLFRSFWYKFVTTNCKLKNA